MVQPPHAWVGVGCHADRVRGSGRGGRPRALHAALWLRPDYASASRGGVATGGGRTFGLSERTTAGRGRRCDRYRSGWAAVELPRHPLGTEPG